MNKYVHQNHMFIDNEQQKIMNKNNHIDALDSAILIDRKRGEFFQLEHISQGVFKAIGTNCARDGITYLRKIASGLAIRRYRILEVKN